MRRWFWFRLFYSLHPDWNRNPIKRSLPFSFYRSIKFSGTIFTLFRIKRQATWLVIITQSRAHRQKSPKKLDNWKYPFMVRLQKWYKLVLSARGTKICDCWPRCHASPCLLVSAAESRQHFFVFFCYSFSRNDCFIFVDVGLNRWLLLCHVGGCEEEEETRKKLHRREIESINPKLDYWLARHVHEVWFVGRCF